CHDPHRPLSAERSCLTCHKAASCTDHPRLPAPVRGDCVGCHMPPRLRMHFHFYTTTDERYVPIGPRPDHRIGVYPQGKQAVLLAWLRKQPDAKSRAEVDRLAGQLSQFWLKEANLRLRTGRLTGAMCAYREALKIDPSPAIRQKLQDTVRRQAELDELAVEG